MDKIGKYSLIHEIGRGATATVYLGHDPFAQRDVAIKIATPAALRHAERGTLYTHLFMNEAALVGRLVHPHIVQIYDAVVAEELCYIVMEYVAGGTLEACCQAQTLLSPERIVEIVFKCSRALDFAYRSGITHRDIKPANILLVSPTGQDIKISDFGAAIFTATETTQIPNIGSPAYMSPEQVREQPIDHHTDIYSLGVVMYQLLTGQRPFEGSNNASLAYQIVHHVPPPPSSLRPEVPPELDAIVCKAMQRDVDQRYATWMEFSHDLAQAYRNRKLAPDRVELPESEKFERLRAFHFFREFSDVEIWEIVRLSEWRSLEVGTVVMKEGEPGNYFCVLVEGRLRVLKQGHLLNTLSPGDCFGEMALFTAGRGARTSSVEATSEACILTIRAPSLLRASAVCQMHFYKGFLEVLATRLSVANSRIASV